MTKNCFLLFILAFGLILFSCGNDDDQPEPQKQCDPDGDCFRAKIDGQLFEGEDVKGIKILFGVINIAAAGPSGAPTFAVNLVNTAEGTYDFAPQADVTATYSPSVVTSTDIYAAISGSLTIQSHDTTARQVSGIFNFEGINANNDTVQVTEGFFDLGYQ